MRALNDVHHEEVLEFADSLSALAKCKDFSKRAEGSNGYWKKFRSNCFAMINTCGNPSFFYTFSMNEMDWVDHYIECTKADRRVLWGHWRSISVGATWGTPGGTKC